MADCFADNFEDDFGSPTSTPSAKKPLWLATSAHPTAPSMDGAFTKAYKEDCKACRGAGRFTSWSGRTLGECFKCKGKGFHMFKTNAADRAAKRAQAAASKVGKAEQALTDFAAQHPAAWAWIEGSKASFDFARSMHDAILKFGSLTPNQLAACERAAVKFAAAVAARAEQRAQTVAAAPVIDMTKIEAAFGSALASGLKSPKLRIGALVISPAKATSANAGALYVKARGQDGAYFGKIMGGKFLKSRECDAETEALIVETAKDPLAAAVAYGKATGICSCCGAELTNKLSIELGIGPICRSKWGMG